MSMFKVGDRVRIKGFDEVQYHKCISRESWREAFSNPCKVVCVEDDNYQVEAHTGDRWWVRADSLVSPDSKIIITTDGTTTLARMYEDNKVIKNAEAKCSPHDTFDFATGANLAYDRLMGRLAKEEKPTPEYYNGKVVCIKDFVGFTVGKGYCFTDGSVTDDDGDKRSECGRHPIRDLSDGWERDIFIEFKGEAQ